MITDKQLMAELRALQASFDAEIQENEEFLAKFRNGELQNVTCELLTRPEARADVPERLPRPPNLSALV